MLPHGTMARARLRRAILRHSKEQRIAGAIQTDFILSAEIMAITLAGVADQSFWTQAAVLAIVGIGITVVVYGVVALIVKADDAGVALAANQRPATSLLGLRRAGAGRGRRADRALSSLTRPLGRGLVIGMPYFLTGLGVVGTAAMLWVGGGIIIHGLEGYGFSGLGHAVHDLAVAAGRALPAAVAAAGEWLAGAVLAAVFGLVVGGIVIVAMHWLVAPLLKLFRKAATQPAGEKPGA